MTITDTPVVGDAEVAWTINGVRRAVDLLDIDGVEWRDAKNAAQTTQARLVSDACVQPVEFDCIAAILWVWERRTNADLAYEDVLAEFSYKSFPVESVVELGPGLTLTT